jgi:hypothetical protein
MRVWLGLACAAMFLTGCATRSDENATTPWGLVQSSKAPASDYPALLAAAKADPATANWTALRAAYAASPAYDTSMGEGPAVKASIAAMNAGQWPEANAQAQVALQANWMDLRAHLLAAAAKSNLNGASPSDVDLIAAEAILHSIQSTGDGHSTKTAFHVLAVSEEYVLLELGHAKSAQQRLVQDNGHFYDMLAAVDTRTGGQGWVYFNIDIPFAREKALATGQAKVQSP